VSDFHNSQDFNDISSAINQLIEARILPRLRDQAEVGKQVQFTGCVEVMNEDTDLRPLLVVPSMAEIP
jgi:predicted lipoprotein